LRREASIMSARVALVVEFVAALSVARSRCLGSL
jgi:hypothetical protein